MAAVKDGRELLKIIVEETQPVFGFYDIGLAVIDKSGDFYVDWAVFYGEINPSAANVAQREARNYKFAADDKLINYALERAATEKKPYIENLTARLIEEFSDFSQLSIEIAHGYRQFLVTALKSGGEALGILTFNSLRENHFERCDFELFQAIADLVAVAVANIRANDEIIEREREKTRLLEITELIAQIKANDDLLRLIVDKIKPLFGFKDCGLFVLSADKQTHTDLAAVLPGVSPSEFNERIAAVKANHNVSHPGSVVESVMRKIETAGKPLFVRFR
jgi:hypothetical protein